MRQVIFHYRLKTFQDLQNDPVFSTVHNIDTIKKDDNFQRLNQLGSDTKVSELTEWIFDPNLRHYLANLDSLYTSALVDENNGYGFSFPPASHLLPTYKRYYDGKTENNPCRRLAKDVTKENIRGCYFNKKLDSDSISYNEGRKAFELGWLDRIGYKARVKVQPLPGQALQLESKDGIVLSDHTPVLLKVQVRDT